VTKKKNKNRRNACQGKEQGDRTRKKRINELFIKQLFKEAFVRIIKYWNFFMS